MSVRCPTRAPSTYRFMPESPTTPTTWCHALLLYDAVEVSVFLPVPCMTPKFSRPLLLM